MGGENALKTGRGWGLSPALIPARAICRSSRPDQGVNTIRGKMMRHRLSGGVRDIAAFAASSASLAAELAAAAASLAVTAS